MVASTKMAGTRLRQRRIINMSSIKSQREIEQSPLKSRDNKPTGLPSSTHADRKTCGKWVNNAADSNYIGSVVKQPGRRGPIRII